MKLWEFEPLLVARLSALPGVASAQSFAEADVPLLYGCSLTSTSGRTVHVHLVRGSGPVDRLDPPPEHHANVERVAGRDVPRTPAPDVMAEAVEGLLRQALTGFTVGALTNQRGVKVDFNDGSTIYASLFT